MRCWCYTSSGPGRTGSGPVLVPVTAAFDHRELAVEIVGADDSK
jgi:hypothetical protein